MCEGAGCVMVIVVGNGYGNPCSIPGQGCGIPRSANTLKKSMNQSILPPDMCN